MTANNKSLDASGWSVFRKMIGPAAVERISVVRVNSEVGHTH